MAFTRQLMLLNIEKNLRILYHSGTGSAYLENIVCRSLGIR